MPKTMLFATMALFGVLLASRAFAAPAAADLVPYLQAEVNEIATLTAQANYLQQQGDPVGASIVASYVPDHQMQAALLSAQITALGGNPAQVTPQGTPFLGTRDAIISRDLKDHADGIAGYKTLATSTDPTFDKLALFGINGASRHFLSLQIAQAATLNTPDATRTGLAAALTLEMLAVADLQTQAARLNQLGDAATANALLSLVPQHQMQVASLSSQFTVAGGNPATIIAPQVAAFDTRDQIIASERTFNTQLVNTYAFAIASLPATNPLRLVAQQGQGIALAALYHLSGMQAVVACL